MGETEDVRKVDSALNSHIKNGRRNVLILKTYWMSSVNPSPGNWGLSKMVKLDFHSPWERGGSHCIGITGHHRGC